MFYIEDGLFTLCYFCGALNNSTLNTTAFVLGDQYTISDSIHTTCGTAYAERMCLGFSGFHYFIRHQKISTTLELRIFKMRTFKSQM